MNAESSISLFTNLTYVCIAVAVLGLGLAIFFFFFFKIPTVYAFLTGKAKKEMIEKMAEENAKSGKLRNQNMFGHTGPTGTTGDLGKTGPTGRVARTGFTGRINGTQVPLNAQPVNPAMAQTEQIGQQAMETAVLTQDAETSVLSHEGETSVLNHDGETGVLSQPDVERKRVAPRNDETAILTRKAPSIRFDMTENTVLIHTNEII